MVQDIWKILGIEPTKDVTAIKRAYTSLAHEINPEDEPERYAELHGAYKRALDYAKGKGAVLFHRDPVFVAVPVRDRNSDPDADPAFTEQVDDGFDFSQIDIERLNQNTVSDIMADDIIDFRNTNRLTSYAEIRKLPQKLRIEFAQRLLNMYYSLAERSGELIVWEAFWDEPLIRYCDGMGGFRSWLFEHFEEDSPHIKKLTEIIEDRARKYRERYELPENPGKKEAKKNYAKSKLVIFIITLVFILVLIPVFCIIRPDPDMFAIVGAVILMAGVGIAMFYLAKSLH